MLLEYFAHLFKDILKEKYAGFAYWLFYSEMTVALLVALIAFAWGELLGGAVFSVYAALNYVAARNYERKEFIKLGKISHSAPDAHLRRATERRRRGWEPHSTKLSCTLASARGAPRLGPRARRCQTVDLPELSRP